METIEMDQDGDFIEDLSSEQLLSPYSSDACGVLGDPEILPRVGNQYQVKIPELITGPDYAHYTKSPTDAEDRDSVHFDFLMGLPILVMWINKETEKAKNEKQEISSDLNDVFDKDASSEFEKVKGPGYWLVPGSCGELWNDMDKASFLLGLYIFEKDFVQVQRFVGSKKMGDILSFYYGKFYRSNEYSRWSTCRKIRRRKRIYGQRIFSGLRHQELLSRLVPHVSDECQKAFLEVSKTFGEGKMPLEEYVTSLKGMVGMNILVEAVGIGKGKKDLTAMAVDPGKSNQATRIRQDIPSGKACSSLTPTEIVEFLTGGYRLSKARSNDLFWEAVWPRLLARGWHSEQPKKQVYVPGAKNSLVFLISGVKKFSRRRLVKGTHYFDSVADVLGKVGSEPGLLELDNEEDDEGNNEIKEPEDFPKRQRHSYLQPRTPSRRNTADVMKFTVVDTSMPNGKKLKFRELRTLPTEISKKRSLSEESDEGSSEVSTNESDCGNTMLLDQEETKFNKVITFDGKCPDISYSEQGVQINGPDSAKPVKKPEKHIKDERRSKAAKLGHLRRKLKQNALDCSAPVTKRQRTLTDCSKEEMSSVMNSSPLIPGEEVGSSQDRLSSTSSPKGSPRESIVGVPDDNYNGPEYPQDNNQQARTLIDLNLPQLPQESENGAFMTDSTNPQDDMTSKQQRDDLNEPKTYVDMTSASCEQQSNMNSVRSTRNRLPTARALEALVNGYLTTRVRQKKESNARGTSTSRTSRKRTDNAVPEGEGGTSVCDGGNSDMFEQLQVLSNGNATQISNP